MHFLLVISLCRLYIFLAKLFGDYHRVVLSVIRTLSNIVIINFNERASNPILKLFLTIPNCLEATP